MSHPDFVRPSGQWPSELVPTPADAQRLDVSQARLINGDAGGTWNNAKPIIIGGAGMSYSAGSARGGARTQQGGRIILGAGAGAIPQLSPQRVRTTTMHLHEVLVPAGGISNSNLQEDWLAISYGPPDVFGVQLLGTALTTSLQLSIPRRSLHSGAQIQTVTLNYRLLARPAALPSSRMSILLSNATAANGAGITYQPAAIGTWALNTHYAVGAYITPTAANATGYYYKATSESGTGTSSATTEPTWPTTIGATITDNAGSNQIVWTCTGRVGVQAPYASVDVYYNGGKAQSVSFDFDSAAANLLDTTANKYAVVISNVDTNALLHSVQFVMGYSSLAFE